MIKDIISQHIRIGNSLFQQINQIENVIFLMLIAKIQLEFKKRTS